MNKVSIVIFILLDLLGASLLVSADNTKVDVCHSQGNGSYILINISEPAFPSHIDHGDNAPGEQVPGREVGWTFSADCIPMPSVTYISFSCNSEETLIFVINLLPDASVIFDIETGVDRGPGDLIVAVLNDGPGVRYEDPFGIVNTGTSFDDAFEGHPATITVTNPTNYTSIPIVVNYSCGEPL